MQEADLIVPWLALNVTGQWCLSILLVTYALARELPQRNNAYLINFILTSFLGSIPPSMLTYLGYQYSPIPYKLCVAQAALVNGVAPMFAVSQLALVFDTWSELRSQCLHTRHYSRVMFVKCVALIVPYFAFGCFTVATFQGAVLGSAVYLNRLTQPANWVYCRLDGAPISALLNASGVFLAVFFFLQLFFELWVAWMIYAYPSKVQDDPTTWRTSIQFSLRIIILGILQFLTVLLSVLKRASNNNDDSLKQAYEMLDSMYALAVFLVVGVETNVLLTWRAALKSAWNFVTRKKPEEVEEELQPHGFPVLDWAYVPSKRYEPADGPQTVFGNKGGELDRAEKGQSHGMRIAFPKFALRLGTRGR